MTTSHGAEFFTAGVDSVFNTFFSKPKTECISNRHNMKYRRRYNKSWKDNAKSGYEPIDSCHVACIGCTLSLILFSAALFLTQSNARTSLSKKSTYGTRIKSKLFWCGFLDIAEITQVYNKKDATLGLVWYDICIYIAKWCFQTQNFFFFFLSLSLSLSIESGQFIGDNPSFISTSYSQL